MRVPKKVVAAGVGGILVLAALTSPKGGSSPAATTPEPTRRPATMATAAPTAMPWLSITSSPSATPVPTRPAATATSRPTATTAPSATSAPKPTAAPTQAASPAPQPAKPAVAPSAAPSPVWTGYTCDKCIKGNISDDGRKLYHLPTGCPSYASTKIDESKGERWFSTEAEARAAGWTIAGNCK